MNTLSATNQTSQFFNAIVEGMGSRSQISLDPARVELHVGKARNVVIIDNMRTIDLSEDENGNLLPGTESKITYPGHNDERDEIITTRAFPQSPEDFDFLSGIASQIRQTI